MVRNLPFLLVFSAAAGCLAPRPPPTPVDLSTEYARSEGLRTGRYAEAERLCAAHAWARPERFRCLEFGRTPEGRPMLALVASAAGAFDPSRRDRPVVLALGGIHAGEIDGKDAGFLLLEELAAGDGGPLQDVTLVFVPVFNVDGHERFGPWNRPNQAGPAQMGWRTTAQNLNLNRDWLKADSPEMRALLALVEAWDPLVTLDLHVTDGAEFQHDVSLVALPVDAGPAPLVAATRALRDEALGRLKTRGHKPLSFYPSFRVEDDPASGFANGVPPPRLSHGYFWLRNRIGILVETHSWKPYPVRVQATLDTLRTVLDLAARDGPAWLSAARDADARSAALAGATVPLAFEPTGEATTVDFLGYAYRRERSPISGVDELRYDTNRPEIQPLPFFAALRPKLGVTAPSGGWLVPAAQAALVGARLRAHGLTFETLAEPRPALAVEVFRATAATFASTSYEGRQLLTVEGAWSPESRNLPAGSLYVPVAQPRARIALHLLEPQAPDSLLAWGFFNAHFERKEYMEAYVVDAAAQELLARTPALAAEFQHRLATDAKFAADPAARRDFFYRRHPSWDERLNLYPVLRVASRP